jgi:hypothetical protein
MGCNLKTYVFFIFNCYGKVLEAFLQDFRRIDREGMHEIFNLRLHHTDNLRHIELQGYDGGGFQLMQQIPIPASNTDSRIKIETKHYRLFRIRVITKEGREFFSPEIQLQSTIDQKVSIRPNPIWHQLFIQGDLFQNEKVDYSICNSVGLILTKGHFKTGSSLMETRIETGHLPKGIYYIHLRGMVSKRQSLHSFMKI